MMESINKARANECDTPEDFLEILNNHAVSYTHLTLPTILLV